MIENWVELRSYANERFQQRIAEGEEWRLARQAAAPGDAGAAPWTRWRAWQGLSSMVRRLAARPARQVTGLATS